MKVTLLSPSNCELLRTFAAIPPDPLPAAVKTLPEGHRFTKKTVHSPTEKKNAAPGHLCHIGTASDSI